MKQIKLYLPKESDRKAEDWRWLHLSNCVDRKYAEVRVYVVGSDITEEDLEYSTPYMTIDGKHKSFKNAWKMLNPSDKYISRAL